MNITCLIYLEKQYSYILLKLSIAMWCQIWNGRRKNHTQKQEDFDLQCGHIQWLESTQYPYKTSSDIIVKNYTSW